MRPKPHIYRYTVMGSRGRRWTWFCDAVGESELGRWGAGDTPMDAYRVWAAS